MKRKIALEEHARVEQQWEECCRRAGTADATAADAEMLERSERAVLAIQCLHRGNTARVRAAHRRSHGHSRIHATIDRWLHHRGFGHEHRGMGHGLGDMTTDTTMF